MDILVIKTVLRSVLGKRKCCDPLPIHSVIQLEQDGNRCPRQECMRLFQGNIAIGHVADIRCLETIGGHVLFDRKMRKLYSFRPANAIDDGDE